MTVSKWTFSFAEVELYPDKLIARSNVDYKQLEKNYRDLIKEVGSDCARVLSDAFEKKKTQVIAFAPALHERLRYFFTAIGTSEGVQERKEEERKAEPARPASSGARQAGEEKRGISISVKDATDMTLTHEGDVIEVKQDGAIVVENNGSEKAWDMYLPVTKEEGISLEGDAITLAEVLPGEPVTIAYGWETTEGATPALAITETVNTMPSSDVPATFFIHDPDGNGSDVAMAIDIENTGEHALSGVSLVKTLPDLFREIRPRDASKGTASTSGTTVTWDVGTLDPGEKATLPVAARAFATEMTRYSSGELVAEYVVERAGIEVDQDTLSIHASRESFIEVSERDEEPDTWDTAVTFKNTSPFTVLLRAMTVGYVEAGNEATVVKEFTPGIELQPGESWDAEAFEIKNEAEPLASPLLVQPVTFTRIDATVIPAIVQETRTTLNVQGMDLPVIALEASKEFDTTEIPSFKDTPVNATVTVNVIGSAVLDRVTVQDEIPEHFIPPKEEEVEVFVGGKKLAPGDYTVSFDGNNMAITIPDMAKLGELADGAQIKVEYPMVASNLPKEYSISTQGTARAWLPGSDKPVEATYGLAAAVSVVHRRRRTQIGKSVVPGSAPGDYEIVLIYRNKGDARKDNVPISDFVPESFTILDASLEYDAKKEKGGSLMTWTIPTIEPNAEFEIAYKIHGEGDAYSLKEVSARSFK